MPETKLKEIADHADMIIRGYAFTKAGDSIRVFNLNDKESSMVIAPNGTLMCQGTDKAKGNDMFADYLIVMSRNRIGVHKIRPS